MPDLDVTPKPVLRVVYKEEGETIETIEVTLLNVGQIFEGFGGSKHPLVAGRDFATGTKDKKPTASIIVRRTSRMGLHDKEYSIQDPDFWTWVKNLMNAFPEGHHHAETP